MSISKFQERVLGSSCQKVLIFGIVAVMAGSLLATAQCGAAQDAQPGAMIGVAQVGNVDLSSREVEMTIEAFRQRQMQQFGQIDGPMPTLPPLMEASMMAAAIDEAVEGALRMVLAQEMGIDLSDESLRKQFEQDLESQIPMVRMQLEMNKKLKEGATEKEFQDAFAKEFGRDLTTVRQEQSKLVDEQLKNPEQRQAAVRRMLEPLIMQALQQSISVSDADLKAQFDTVEVKRILLKDEGDKKATDTATQVIADIKAGELTFEQAMDRFSRDAPQPGKKVSESSLSLSGSSIMTIPEYRGLRGLKAGSISEPIELAEGVAIYRVVKVTPNLPEDFNQRKDEYRKNLGASLASEEQRKRLEALEKRGIVKWRDPGYQALYEYSQILANQELSIDAAAREQAYRKVLETARKALGDIADGENVEPGKEGSTPPPPVQLTGNPRVAAWAQYAAFEGLWNNPGADKAKLSQERVQVLQELLQYTESPQIRAELVDMALQQKDRELANDQLLSMAANNVDYTVSGQQQYSQVASLMSRLKSAGLLDQSAEASIVKEQERWRKEKVTYETEQAEFRRQQEEDRKRFEAERKAEEARFKAEQQKRQNKGSEAEKTKTP